MVISEPKTEHFQNGVTCTTFDDGSYVWRKGQKLHREDGPAVYFRGGYRKWYINSDLHREDGPACIYESGTIEWYLRGVVYPFEEWCKAVDASDALVTKLTLEYALQIIFNT